MAETLLSSFECPGRHAAISDLIRNRSTNPRDVRDAVLASLDLAAVRRALDLGCGFGFMTAAVARRLPADAEIVGVDACESNRGPYLAAVAAAGRRGRFIAAALDTQLDWPDRSFDLVLASYALYFFPELVPEIARVLTGDGLFLAVTHTASSDRALALAAGVPPAQIRRLGAIERFCVENAEAVLRPWFAAIERVDYANTLVFEPGQHAEFLEYLRFKRPHLGPDAAAWLASRAAACAPPARIELEKNDAAYCCRGPRCR